jgi:vacuolar protein sorting-associated protein 13A/C
VVLTGLRLKKDALDQLDLPIEIVRGYVGELRLEIPWANLKSKPVIITLDKIYVQALPIEVVDAERFIEKQLKDKLDRLATSELLRASAARMPIKTEQQEESFTANLVNKIVDNLQMTIKDIHIRFEDNDRAFSIGICLSELRAFSVDEMGVEKFISESKEEIYKSAELSRLFIYSDREKLKIGSDSDWMGEMTKIIEGDENKAFILRPVKGLGTAYIQRHPVKGKPRIVTKLSLEEIGCLQDRMESFSLPL